MDYKKEVDLFSHEYVLKSWHKERKNRVHKNCGGVVMPDGYCMNCQKEGVSKRSLEKMGDIDGRRKVLKRG